MSESWLLTGVCAAGKTTVGRLLAERLVWVVERLRPCRVVVLAPEPEAVAARDEARAEDGYAGWSLRELDRGLREETPRLGLWLDTPDLSAAETVEAILARAEEARA